MFILLLNWRTKVTVKREFSRIRFVNPLKKYAEGEYHAVHTVMAE